MLEVVDQPVVDLIGDEDQVMLFGDLRNLGQHVAAGHRAGGIVGIADEDGLGARGDGLPDARRIDLESYPPCAVGISTGTPPAMITSGW